jgi:hypothetical protein
MVSYAEYIYIYVIKLLNDAGSVEFIYIYRLYYDILYIDM